MKYLAEIIFGKDQVRKFKNNEPFNDFEKVSNFKKYNFESRAERNAFYKGINEAMGWLEVELVKEFEEKISTETADEDMFFYWSFIEKYYPKYSHCNNVLLSDILTRKLTGEEISEKDEEYIKDWDVRKELLEVDKDLLCKAFENYFNIVYPVNLIIE